MASHMGLLLDRPSVGCAKSVLIGDYNEPGFERGASSPLISRGTKIGVALRTRTGVDPIFVSVGHKIDPTGAVKVVLGSAPRYRLPEPMGGVHRLSNAVKAASA